ncbi:halo-CC-star protein HcsS [Halorubrum sp. AD140]|uniref:halo-CC-star protein HcsS n=1 Tax=Halorubrum sp. AD140 TaxID=3050073 RepID=UPI002ACCA97F|nr:halo-CC-star protein HcsS [Halorubrum sp. AD140]MDZ5813014.1 halo-CC-star protein HcsS [Halorubrum sp. AD140]
MLLSTSERNPDVDGATDEAVLAAAETLGEELAAAKDESSEFAFTTMVMQCNEAIGDETGIDYGSVCGADDDGCC